MFDIYMEKALSGVPEHTGRGHAKYNEWQRNFSKESHVQQHTHHQHYRKQEGDIAEDFIQAALPQCFKYLLHSVCRSVCIL